MAEAGVPKSADEELLRMTTEVVAAYVSNNTLATGQLGDVIHAVYNSLRSLDGRGEVAAKRGVGKPRAHAQGA